MPRLNSLAFRLVAAAVAVSLLGLAAGGWLLSNAFRASVERQFDSRLLADLENLVAAADPTPDGTLAVEQTFTDQRYQTAFSGWYWQVTPLAPPPTGQETSAGDAARIVTSRSLWDQTLVGVAPAGRVGVARGFLKGPDDQALRYVAREISFPDVAAIARGDPERQRLFLFVVAGDRAATEAEIASFNATLVWSLGGLGALFVLATLIQVVVGLRPLRRVRLGLAAIRSGDAQRLDEDFPAEIAPLAAELNGVLQNNAEIVARARTHVGNLAHFLKTPLSVLANEAGSAKGPLADAVRRQTETMRRQVDHYLARARAAATVDVIGSRTEIEGPLDDLARTLERIHGWRGIDIAIDAQPGLAFRGERQDFEELMGNLMDNACKWARSAVTVTARRDGGRLALSVEDDGPGLTPDEIARVVEKKERLDENVPGTGLGLGIVRDIAFLYGGQVILGRSEALGGLRAELILPAAGG